MIKKSELLRGKNWAIFLNVVHLWFVDTARMILVLVDISY